MNKIIIDKAKEIKLVATDIDGVWTDSKMYYTNLGEHMKSFSTYDGMAVELLHKNNFIVAILTSENSQISKKRAEKLQIKEIYINEKQKLLRLKYLAEKYNISLKEIAFIGDDINDLDSLKAVGFSAMPPNSPILQSDEYRPHYITNCQGGNGAFRDFANQILQANNIQIKY